MKVLCKSCDKLLANIELAKIRKDGMACYCPDCDAARNDKIRRLELLLSMSVDQGKHEHKKQSFKDVMNEYFSEFGDLW